MLGTSAAIASAILTIGLTLAVGLAMKVAGLTQGSPKARLGPPSVFRQSISDSFLIYGKRRVGGLMVFFHPRKVGKRHYRYFVIAVAGHRCQGVTKWFLNDEEVTVNAGTGAVTSGPYAGAAFLWFQRGLASETANATFVAECGGKWTSAHKGNGIAAIYAKFEMTDDVVQAGMPNITAEIEGRDEIRDPRDDTTGYTRNAILCAYDWLSLLREEGGFGAYDDEIPDDDWLSAQANVCDEMVTTPDGTEERYAIDAVIVTGAAPSEIRDVFVVNMAGSQTYSGGKQLIRPGYWVPVTSSLSEADLAGPIQVSAFLPGDQAANEVQGSFVDPAAGYQGMPFATQVLTPAPADIRQLDLELAYITSRWRAARIASIMLKRAQAERQVVWPMNIAGLKVAALDTVQLATSRYGLSNYAWTVTSWGLSSDFNTVISLREENEEIYEEPTHQSYVAPAALAVAEPIIRDSELTNLISTSFVTDADPFDGLLQGTETTIVVESHTRTYSDKTVSITGSTITGLTAESFYHVYYDDDARNGGAVTFIATSNPEQAATTPTQPGRHYVGSISTDALGGTGTSAGGSSPPGWGGDGWTNIP